MWPFDHFLSIICEICIITRQSNQIHMYLEFDCSLLYLLGHVDKLCTYYYCKGLLMTSWKNCLLNHMLCSMHNENICTSISYSSCLPVNYDQWIDWIELPSTQYGAPKSCFSSVHRPARNRLETKGTDVLNPSTKLNASRPTQLKSFINFHNTSKPIVSYKFAQLSSVKGEMHNQIILPIARRLLIVRSLCLFS